MKRGDIVKIKRGIWKGCEAKVTEVTSGGKRVGVSPLGVYQPYSLAVTSVEPVTR